MTATCNTPDGEVSTSFSTLRMVLTAASIRVVMSSTVKELLRTPLALRDRGCVRGVRQKCCVGTDYGSHARLRYSGHAGFLMTSTKSVLWKLGTKCSRTSALRYKRSHKSQSA